MKVPRSGKGMLVLIPVLAMALAQTGCQHTVALPGFLSGEDYPSGPAYHNGTTTGARSGFNPPPSGTARTTLPGSLTLAQHTQMGPYGPVQAKPDLLPNATGPVSLKPGCSSPYEKPLAGADMVFLQPSGPDLMIPGPGGMGGGPVPTELNPVSHGPYTVAPPDILVLSAPELFPRKYAIQPFDVLEVLIFQPTSPLAEGDPAKKGLKEPLIAGEFKVTPEGKLLLPILGMPTAIPIAGMSIEEATKAIHSRLSQALKNVDVFINLKTIRPMGQIAGEHLVRPDGTINLGQYGYAYVAGMTLGQIKTVIEKHLEKYVLNPSVAVDVRSYNSKKYYLIIDGGGYGQLVFAYPYTGYETVLDGVAKLSGLPWWASKKKIWVARPAPCDHPCLQVLPVDWNAITQGGATCTNWQLMPGDRIYVKADCLITANNWITKVLNPVNQILNTTLLGTTTINTIRNPNTSGVGFVASVP